MLHSLPVLLGMQLVGLRHPLYFLHLCVHHPESTPCKDSHQHEDQQEQGAESQFDYLGHEVDTVDVVDEAEFIGEGVAVGGDDQTVEGVCDEVVEGRDCPVELGYPTVEGGQLGVEVVVAGEQGVEVVLDGLEEVDPAIPEGDQGGSVQLDSIVGIGIGIPDLNVPHCEIAEGPDR